MDPLGVHCVVPNKIGETLQKASSQKSIKSRNEGFAILEKTSDQFNPTLVL